MGRFLFISSPKTLVARGMSKMVKIKKVFCPHCKQKVDKGNFCGNCGQKLVRVCDCWILEKPFNCGFQKCPNIWETEVAILKIFNNSQDKLYRIFHKPAFEALIPIALRTGYNFSGNKGSIFGTRAFCNNIRK